MQEDERPPPVRLLYADELGQLKGEPGWEAQQQEARRGAMHAAWSSPPPPPPPLPAVVQTADGAQLGTAAVADTW